jgi:hypothetical protein
MEFSLRQLERIGPEQAIRMPSVREMIDPVFAALAVHPSALRDVQRALDEATED